MTKNDNINLFELEPKAIFWLFLEVDFYNDVEGLLISYKAPFGLHFVYKRDDGVLTAKDAFGNIKHYKLTEIE